MYILQSVTICWSLQREFTNDFHFERLLVKIIGESLHSQSLQVATFIVIKIIIPLE